jgi:hypothetical protein
MRVMQRNALMSMKVIEEFYRLLDRETIVRHPALVPPEGFAFTSCDSHYLCGRDTGEIESTQK